MADEKLSELSDAGTLTAADLKYVVKSDGASPPTYTSYQTTVQKEMNAVNVMTEDTSPDGSADFLLSYDASASAAKKVKPNTVLGLVNGLTEDTTPDGANDFVLTYDASASAPKKVKPNNLSTGFSITGLTEDTTPDQSADFVPTYDASASGNKKVLLKRIGVGKHTIWVPALAMTARTTNGAATGSGETTTNKVMRSTLDFDTSTQEFAQFTVTFPKGWNEGTVTFIPYWSHASTATNFGVVWALQGVALSDDDAQDTAFGTEQTSTDTGGTTDDVYVGPESSAITIAGSPAVGDIVVFQIKRNVSDGSDTLGVDARLHGVKIIFSTDTNTDD